MAKLLGIISAGIALLALVYKFPKAYMVAEKSDKVAQMAFDPLRELDQLYIECSDSAQDPEEGRELLNQEFGSDRFFTEEDTRIRGEINRLNLEKELAQAKGAILERALDLLNYIESQPLSATFERWKKRESADKFEVGMQILEAVSDSLPPTDPAEGLVWLAAKGLDFTSKADVETVRQQITHAAQEQKAYAAARSSERRRLFLENPHLFKDENGRFTKNHPLWNQMTPAERARANIQADGGYAQKAAWYFESNKQKPITKDEEEYIKQYE